MIFHREAQNMANADNNPNPPLPCITLYSLGMALTGYELLSHDWSCLHDVTGEETGILHRLNVRLPVIKEQPSD
jgi:hypothetical protein